MKVFLLSLALLIPALHLQAEGTFYRYLQDAASQDDAEAQCILGLVCRDGWSGTIKPGSIVAKWRELAKEMHDERPELLLRVLAKESVPVLRDEAKAIAWLGSAAGHGDNYAQVILGDMLLEGDGVTANWLGGTEWMKKSADAGFAPAQFRLGLIYMVGDASLPMDQIESLAWFIVAAASGSKPAQEYRDERTQLLGREIARLAIKRSGMLSSRNDGKKHPAPDLASN